MELIMCDTNNFDIAAIILIYEKPGPSPYKSVVGNIN